MIYWWDDIKIKAVSDKELNQFPSYIIEQYGNQLCFEGKFNRYLTLYQQKNIPLYVVKQVLDSIHKDLFYRVCNPNFRPHLSVLSEDSIEALPAGERVFWYTDWPENPQGEPENSEVFQLYSTATPEALETARANFTKSLVAYDTFIIWAITSRTWLVRDYGVVDRLVQLHRDNCDLRKKLKLTEDRLLPYGFFKVIEDAWKQGKSVKEAALELNKSYGLSLAQVGALLSFKIKTDESCKQWGIQLVNKEPTGGDGWEWQQKRPKEDKDKTAADKKRVETTAEEEKYYEQLAMRLGKHSAE